MVLKNQTKIVTIIGNIGSGKTTLSVNLAKKLKAKLIKADNLYLTNPFFPLTVRDRKRWSLASDLWFLNERARMLKKEVETKKQFVIIDCGLPISWTYSHSRIKSGYYIKDEWQLYQTYYRLLTKATPPIDILVDLIASSDLLMERIKKRGRDFEKKYFDVAYLESIANSLKQYKKRVLTPATKIITIDIEKIDLRKPEYLQALIKSIQSK